MTPSLSASSGDTLQFDASTSSGPALITGASWRFGDGGSADTTALGGNGRSYSGLLGGSGLRLQGPATIATGGCGDAVVDVDWRASLTDPDTLSGTATAFFDLRVGCQCTAAWSLTGTRR